MYYLPLLPGGAILELGAGSGLWTQQLVSAVSGQNPVTAAVFNENLIRLASARKLLNAHFVRVNDLLNQFPPESFDYVLGSDVVSEDLCAPVLAAAYQWLKPGGQVLYFAQNPSTPLTLLQDAVHTETYRRRHGKSRVSVHRDRWIEEAFRAGFRCAEVVPREVFVATTNSTVSSSVTPILERAPIVRRFARTVCLQAVKSARSPVTVGVRANLAVHKNLLGAVSVVVPCHNEEANVEHLVRTLLRMYDDYIHEIIVVDDNSSDQTVRVVQTVASSEPRVKLLRRSPPSGVGRALREGYAAATGQYILTMDADFVHIAPEFRGLFDVVAKGHDGAIGSRFSTDSVLIRYPFSKIICNRGYHLLLNLFLNRRFRDISNNLKLYRAGILKNLDIEQEHFAANVETGLKPLLLGYDIREVPISWINRTQEMGQSSFRLLKVAPGYLSVLLRTVWRTWRGQYPRPSQGQLSHLKP